LPIARSFAPTQIGLARVHTRCYSHLLLQLSSGRFSRLFNLLSSKKLQK